MLGLRVVIGVIDARRNRMENRVQLFRDTLRRVTLRESLSTSFCPSNPPGWICSRSGLGHPVLSKKHLVVIETTDSILARRNDENDSWDPDCTQERFSAPDVQSLQRPVSVAGTTDLEQQPPDGEYGTVLRPIFVHPAPRLLPRPQHAPAEVNRLLTRCEELFWSDFAGCANAIRAVIEAILTDQKVKRFALSRSGKRTPITLHHRILSFGKTEPTLAEKMLAVKWGGNAGSHEGAAPKRADIFDSFDLLEHVLEEVYEKKSAYLAQLAKKITKAKGPLSAKKKKRKR